MKPEERITVENYGGHERLYNVRIDLTRVHKRIYKLLKVVPGITQVTFFGSDKYALKICKGKAFNWSEIHDTITSIIRSFPKGT
ncbi:MAG: hypothetical protein KAR06_11105 [Deltaproteobacteria bacterium]|nr:hypothetical protein [Deltaproteobacteria bacterium]